MFDRLRPSKIVDRRLQAEGKVLSGPFNGMKYLEKSICSNYGGKVLGTYEQELFEVIEQLCRRRFDRLLNVGAAEGYYGVGFLFRDAVHRCIAFESNVEAHELIRQLASLNGVQDRIEVRGTCSLETLEAALQPNPQNTLLIMDVEGAEDWLLDPASVPSLRFCEILVEVHDGPIVGAIHRALETRFAESHSIACVWAKGRTLADAPFTLGWPLNWGILCAMNEHRKLGVSWLHLQPK